MEETIQGWKLYEEIRYTVSVLKRVIHFHNGPDILVCFVFVLAVLAEKIRLQEGPNDTFGLSIL